jgi:hypothetical protein
LPSGMRRKRTFPNGMPIEVNPSTVYQIVNRSSNN